MDDLAPFRVELRDKGATDHVPFLPYQVPAFNFDQQRYGNRHIHHSKIDTYEYTQPDELRQSIVRVPRGENPR